MFLERIENYERKKNRESRLKNVVYLARSSFKDVKIFMRYKMVNKSLLTRIIFGKDRVPHTYTDSMMFEKESKKMKERQISIWFLPGESVYLYSPELFGIYEIKEEKIMKVAINRLGVTYTASNGYVFSDQDIGFSAFHFAESAEQMMKEVLNK